MQVYDEIRQAPCICTEWISKSSALQRTGRVGRVAPGVVFRLYSELFYRDFMSTFGDPEISRAPLEKTVLEVKLVLSRFGSVSQLLSEAMTPPGPFQIASAVERLYKSGALTSNSEDASVTDYGRMSASLPLDLPLSKLIFLGCTFGCPVDAIVMASALSLQDLFTTTFMHDRVDFVTRHSRSFSSRFQFDGGLYSEPLACRSLYAAWLESSRSNAEVHKWQVSLPQMKQMQITVAEISSSLIPILEQLGCDNSIKVKLLIDCSLSRKKIQKSNILF